VTTDDHTHREWMTTNADDGQSAPLGLVGSGDTSVTEKTSLRDSDERSSVSSTNSSGSSSSSSSSNDENCAYDFA